MLSGGGGEFGGECQMKCQCVLMTNIENIWHPNVKRIAVYTATRLFQRRHGA